MTKKSVTTDQLAGMVKHGFDDVGKRLDKVDSRLDKVDSRLDKVDGRLDKVDGRLDHVDARLGRIEADIHEMRDNIVYRDEFEDALSRIKYIEKKLEIKSGK